MSADFWMGAFIGGVIVLGLILLIVGRANSAATKKTGDIVDANQRAHDLLQERNEIDREQNVILGSIATSLEEMELRGRGEGA